MYLWYMYIAILDFLFVPSLFLPNQMSNFSWKYTKLMYLIKCSDVNLLFMIWKELNFSYLITRKAMSLVLLSLLQDSIELVTSVLQHLLKTVTLIGFIILVFGQPYSYLALDLYGGSLLSSGAGMYFIICSIKIHAS